MKNYVSGHPCLGLEPDANAISKGHLEGPPPVLVQLLGRIQPSQSKKGRRYDEPRRAKGTYIGPCSQTQGQVPKLEVSSMPPHSPHLPRSPKTHSISAGYVPPWEGQEKAVRTNRSSGPSEGRGVEVQRLCLSLLRSLPIFRPQVPGALIGGPLHTPLPLFILLLVTPPPLQAMSDACSLPNSRNVESVSLRDSPD